MDARKKVIAALSSALPIEFVRLENGDRITGFVVSPRFEGVSSFDRQTIIEDALANGDGALTPKDQRQVLMIAALTPIEYISIGAPIRIRKVKKKRGGEVEIVFHGGRSDATYIRELLQKHADVQTTEPTQESVPAGTLTSFCAKANGAKPLTKERVVTILASDEYIALAPAA